MLHHTRLGRQGFAFIVIGCGLVAVDWGTFVALTMLGLAPDVANVLGRVVGALVGFAANGGVTFRAADGARYGVARFGRFIILWIALTLVSTVLVTALASRLDLEAAWLAKPVVEALLAVVSFFVSRHWVYV